MSAKKIGKATKRKIAKAAKKAAKKHPVATFIVVLLVVAIVGCCVLHRKRIIHLPFLDGIIPQESVVEDVDGKGGAFSEQDITVIKESDLSIHFLEVGNAYTGDCTLIKVGNTEVLIDAGSRQNSAPTIKEYIDDYCTDGVLEFVIATHAHQDHIAGFVGNKVNKQYNGIFYQYEIGTLIQFARSDQALVGKGGDETVYAKYLDSVKYLKSKNTTVYNALQCYQETDGAKRTYYLDSQQTISMNILYNYFYDHESTGEGGENEYSVCMLLSQTLSEGENHYLFTGDLEEKGEEYLVDNNPNLPECKLFKAGHHGSYTASSNKLLSLIKPEIVCVCCCAGSDEYTKTKANQFPAQDFINRVAEYTENVFVTSIVAENEAGFTSMNGNIVILSNDEKITMRCSNNTTKLKDTDWFKANRTMPNRWKSA